MISATAVSRALGVLGVIGFLTLATSSTATSAGRQEPADAPVLAPFEDPAVAPAAIPAPPLESKPKAKHEALAEPIDAAPAPREPEPVKELPPAPEEPALDVVPAAPAAKTPASPAADEGASPRVGDVTRLLLAAQADGRRAGTALPMLGTQADLAWRRYMDSFTLPIPQWFDERVQIDSN